jgi:hypothetical protein
LHVPARSAPPGPGATLRHGRRRRAAARCTSGSSMETGDFRSCGCSTQRRFAPRDCGDRAGALSSSNNDAFSARDSRIEPCKDGPYKLLGPYTLSRLGLGHQSVEGRCSRLEPRSAPPTQPEKAKISHCGQEPDWAARISDEQRIHDALQATDAEAVR